MPYIPRTVLALRNHHVHTPISGPTIQTANRRLKGVGSLTTRQLPHLVFVLGKVAACSPFLRPSRKRSLIAIGPSGERSDLAILHHSLTLPAEGKLARTTLPLIRG